MEYLPCNATTNMLIVPHHSQSKHVVATQGRDMEARTQVEAMSECAAYWLASLSLLSLLSYNTQDHPGSTIHGYLGLLTLIINQENVS